jgi:hypothetical protein
MPQFGAYLTIVIYDRKTFIVQATGVKVIKRFFFVTDGARLFVSGKPFHPRKYLRQEVTRVEHLTGAPLLSDETEILITLTPGFFTIKLSAGVINSKS